MKNYEHKPSYTHVHSLERVYLLKMLTWTEQKPIIHSTMYMGGRVFGYGINITESQTPFGIYHHKPYRKHVEFRTKINNTHRWDTKPTTVEAKIIKQSIFDL